VTQQQGPKKKLPLEKKLANFYAKRGFKDPMLPALVLALKRQLSGATNQNQWDKVVQDNFRKYQVSRASIESIVKNWDSLTPQFKARWFPKEFVSLDPKRPLDLNLFAKLVRDAAGRFTPKDRAPLPRGGVQGICPPPQITEVRPAGIDFTLALRPGAEFTLIGRNFSSVAAENRIQIGRVRSGTGPVAFDVLFEVTPTSSTTTQLRALAPSALTPGADYNVRVVVNRCISNLWPAYVERPPAPAARLDSISPPTCQSPGQRVLLRGANFMPESLVELEFLDADVSTPGDVRAGYRDIRAGRPSVEFRNANEMYFTIPQETWPGDYSLAVINPGAAPSLHLTFNVCAASYHVELESIYCRDESDWESPGDDEVAVVGKANADGNPWVAFATDEISGFFDGRRRPETGSFEGINLFPSSGIAVPVAYGLYLDYTLVEADDYNKAEAIAIISALGGAADGAIWIIGAIAGATATTIGAITGGVGIVVGIIIVAVLLDRNGYDTIGGLSEVYTAQYLQTHMTSSGGILSLTHSVDFNNDDDTGSYTLSYRIVRAR
jgi:hypothetical protein